MIRVVARLAAVGVLAAGLLTACSDDTPACAANNPKPPPAAKPPRVQPAQPRQPQRPQDRVQQPKTTTSVPKSWGEYKPPHRWGDTYKPGKPAAPQPTVTRYLGGDYRVYPGYPGFYPVGVWPVGYGDAYGCHPLQEGRPVDDD